MGLSAGILGKKSLDYVHPIDYRANDFCSSFVDFICELVFLKVKFCPDIVSDLIVLTRKASQLCIKLFPLMPEAVFANGVHMAENGCGEG